MQIECRPYDSVEEASWDAFIDKNKRNATFLHSRKFFNHNPLNGADDSSLMFYKKNRLKAVFSASVYVKEARTILHSHPRSTYGGFVVDDGVGVEEAVEIVEATIAFAKQKDADEIIIRNPFRIFHQVPSDETDYAMWYHGFKIKSRELECAVKLGIDAALRFENGAKYNIKKAIKYVEVRETKDYAGFWTMLTNNLLEKHGNKPVHTLEQFQTLINMVGEDKIILFGGFVENVMACGVLVFVCNPMALHAQYIASENQYQDIRPLNAVINHIIKWGSVNNYQYFNLGTANEDGGQKINFGLFHFKEGFGGRGILRETMHLILK